MVLTNFRIGLIHVTTCPFDLTFLIATEHFSEEYINGFPALSFTNPKDTRPVKIIDHSSVFMPFAVRDLINPDTFKASNSVPITYEIRGRWF